VTSTKNDFKKLPSKYYEIMDNIKINKFVGMPPQPTTKITSRSKSPVL
jgi:hypothetical protein